MTFSRLISYHPNLPDPPGDLEDWGVLGLLIQLPKPPKHTKTLGRLTIKKVTLGEAGHFHGGAEGCLLSFFENVVPDVV